MGTNYYLHERSNECSHCGRADERVLHIGKSSMGWCFSPHAYPADEDRYSESGAPINNLEDWKDRIFKYRNFCDSILILDEYNEEVSPDVMLAVITERSGGNSFDEPMSAYRGYDSWREFHERNSSEPGPNRLLRARIGEHCIGHGEGTWDYIVGEFS